MESLFHNSLKYIIIDLIWNVLYFPIWWYSKGVKKTLNFCFNQIKETEKYIALSVWVKNIFKPMYAQYDWQGRIISFFIRLIQIIFRAIFLFIWIVLYFLVFLAWIILPILIGYQIYMNILMII